MITLKYYPTESMVADYFTKPLQGSVFLRVRDKIMIKVATINKNYENINVNKKVASPYSRDTLDNYLTIDTIFILTTPILH